MLTVNSIQAEVCAERLEVALSSIDIKGSAAAHRHPSKTLKDAYVEADQRMYQRQRERCAALREAVLPPQLDHKLSAAIGQRSILMA